MIDECPMQIDYNITETIMSLMGKDGEIHLSCCDSQQCAQKSRHYYACFSRQSDPDNQRLVIGKGEDIESAIIDLQKDINRGEFEYKNYPAGLKSVCYGMKHIVQYNYWNEHAIFLDENGNMFSARIKFNYDTNVMTIEDTNPVFRKKYAPH